MRYLLDTDTCIAFLRERDAVIRQRLASVLDSDIVVPAPVRAELYYGAARSSVPARSRHAVDEFLARFHSLPFDDTAADAYGRIRADLAARGMPIGPNDLLIAAIALSHDLTVVTHNGREFGRITGLTVVDWLTQDV